MNTKTIMSLFMVFTMIGVAGAFPAMAQEEITAYAYGSAGSGYYGSVSAMTGAHITYTGELTSGYAGAGSSAQGQEVSSESSAGGYVIGWQTANIGASTDAAAESYYGYSDVSAYGYTGASTLGWIPVEMSTSLSVNADAESCGWCYYDGSVEVGANVGTIADMNLHGTPGIQSNGFAGASAQGGWYGWYDNAAVSGYSEASGNNGVEVGAGSYTVSPGVDYDVELHNWAYAGMLPTP